MGDRENKCWTDDFLQSGRNREAARDVKKDTEIAGAPFNIRGPGNIKHTACWDTTEVESVCGLWIEKQSVLPMRNEIVIFPIDT